MILQPRCSSGISDSAGRSGGVMGAERASHTPRADPAAPEQREREGCGRSGGSTLGEAARASPGNSTRYLRQGVP